MKKGRHIKPGVETKAFADHNSGKQNVSPKHHSFLKQYGARNTILQFVTQHASTTAPFDNINLDLNQCTYAAYICPDIGVPLKNQTAIIMLTMM